jgi:mono/diheme cytochrome c family protein
MAMNLERSYDRLYKILTITGSFICIVFFGFAAVEENFFREWKNYQKEYRARLLSKAGDEKQRQIAEDFPIEIKQVLLTDLGRVDRCVSCHNGIENPKMTGEAPPHAAHSGDYLKHHPLEKFGCSICHGGQDRALGVKSAFAREEGMHWEYPVLPLEYAQSSCGKCHLSVFDENQQLAGAEVLMKGREIFQREGCLGCHHVRGVGGSVGVELTDQGSKTKFEYSFVNIEGDRTVYNWLREHFIEPQSVSQGSEMPAFQLSGDEMNALITFTMALNEPDLATDYYTLDAVREFKGERPAYSGARAWQLFCAVCHGQKGEGKDYRVFKTTTPKLNSQDFLAVASRDMIRYSIAHGRGGRTMSAWNEINGGLSPAEIDALVDHIRGWKEEPPTYADVRLARADREGGSLLYRSRCGTCHGLDGEGGIGPALNNQEFLSIASDEFLFETIVTGRSNTGMPSWSQLSATELASVMAFIRGWQRIPSVKTSTAKITGHIQNGESLFNVMCVGCHGKYGQGSVGPAILNNDFLSAASDEFILHSISRGRGSSAMRSWARGSQGLTELTDREMRDIVAFIRSNEDKNNDAIYTSLTPGIPADGKVRYEGMCAGCHGVNGEGKNAPALNNQEFLAAATDGFLQATIALGRSGTAMRSWAKGAQGYEELNAQQINDIVSYIRTWQKVITGYAEN